MALVRWDPFSEFNSLQAQLSSLFNDTFGTAQSSVGSAPTTDVYSTKDKLVVETHLPNFKDNEITVEQHNGELAIKAEHKEKEKSDEDRNYLVRESVSSYYRRFTLPKNSNSDKIDAKFEDGVLKIVIPYKELPQPKRIEVSAKSKAKKE